MSLVVEFLLFKDPVALIFGVNGREGGGPYLVKGR